MVYESGSLAQNIINIKDSLDKYIVRPANGFGLGGFVFDIEGPTTVTSSADITDHYAEDNSSIQDHVAVRPRKVVLKNYVGELVYRTDANTDTALQTVVRKLTVLSNYAPVLAKAAQQAKTIFDGGFNRGSALSALSGSYGTALSLYAAAKNLIPPTQRQQQAYLFFNALLEQKILVSVQTPFEFMTNMAVESVVATQGEDTRFISDFSITLKQMRFAETQRTTFDKSKYKSPIDNGTGTKVKDINPVTAQNRNVIDRLPTTAKGSTQGSFPTNDDIRALSKDPIFNKVYEPIKALPPSKSISNLPLVTP